MSNFSLVLNKIQTQTVMLHVVFSMHCIVHSRRETQGIFLQEPGQQNGVDNISIQEEIRFSTNLSDNKRQEKVHCNVCDKCSNVLTITHSHV